MGGGAWPFLVGGLICLLNCDNERDLSLLNSLGYLCMGDAAWFKGWVCRGDSVRPSHRVVDLGCIRPQVGDVGAGNRLGGPCRPIQLLRGTIDKKSMEA